MNTTHYRFQAFVTRNRNRLFAAIAAIAGLSAGMDLLAALNGDGSALVTVAMTIACISLIMSIDEVKP